MIKQILTVAATTLAIAITGPPAHASLTPMEPSPIAGDDIGLYTINANDLLAVRFSGAPSAFTGKVTGSGHSLENPPWAESPNRANEQFKGVKSLYQQTTASELVGDITDGAWAGNPNLGGTLTAVPEASTALAGFCLLLPLGIGMVQSLRKMRKV